MKNTPKRLVELFYNTVWNRADEELARVILAKDFRFRGSLGSERQGPDGFIDYMRSIHAALADYHCSIEDLVTSESRATARMTFSGRHQGRLFGIAATGKQISWSGAAFFTIKDEQLSELWVLGDIDCVKQQLGNSLQNPFD